jgi:predicted AAA+ superfamily ATPase
MIIQRLSEKTGITRNTIIHYLHLLEDARIIMQLYSATKGKSRMQKPQKIYLYHPNHCAANDKRMYDFKVIHMDLLFGMD